MSACSPCCPYHLALLVLAPAALAHDGGQGW